VDGTIEVIAERETRERNRGEQAGRGKYLELSGRELAGGEAVLEVLCEHLRLGQCATHELLRCLRASRVDPIRQPHRRRACQVRLPSPVPEQMLAWGEPSPGADVWQG
jgi:hypothetical protein